MTFLRTSPTARVEPTRVLLSILFFCSGFCSLLYQIVWLRVAFAYFGVVTPVLSVVISVFMLGLGLGSWLGGRWGIRISAAFGFSPAILYGLAELLIGAGAIAVPALFALGQTVLLNLGGASSAAYLALSGLLIALILLPWCLLMGTTFPLMMGFARARWPADLRTFSLLYRANVLGAMVGTIASAGALIELLGFRSTSLMAASVNVLIAVGSFTMLRGSTAPDAGYQWRGAAERGHRSVRIALILFTTGFSSLGMEVVWTRAFTIILRTTIYAFASILVSYLLATVVGAAIYRACLRRGRVPADAWLLLAAASTACLPALLDDPRLQSSEVGVLLSIMPFCAALGFLTPKLVDDYSAGDPRHAGDGYAINIVGSILGPLVAGYWLVTQFDVRVSLLILTLPLVALAVWSVARSAENLALRSAGLAGMLALFLIGLAFGASYESYVSHDGPREVRRDYAATAIATGSGMSKGLLVNGVGITFLTPITKLMAHLPMAEHGHARDALAICFGMGTTFRSLMSWGIDVTVVDLTGTVFDLFGYFHADATAIVSNPRAHLVVDDGRRFLMRTDRKFDVITIDPPPPVEAAGSSLLYSREMYAVLKQRLRPGGILQQWFPGGEERISQAVARSLVQSFPYVVAYRSIEGWGIHYLASMQPIPELAAAALAARMPERARQDMLEWGPQSTAEAMVAATIAGRVPITDIVQNPLSEPAITDDRPFNEYYLLRHHHLH